jgi:hypothetical protein
MFLYPDNIQKDATLFEIFIIKNFFIKNLVLNHNYLHQLDIDHFEKYK